MSLLIVGSEATAPSNSGWARMTAASARQSPPSAIVTARFSTVLPGSCTDRAGRHGLNACESSLASPLTWADSSNSAAPADEINDSPPDSTPTPPQRLGFTYGVPFSYPENGPSTSPFSLAGQALPCITRRTITPSSTQPRKIEVNATARALAPSKEALDTPLSPPPLNDEPGPATGHSGAYPDGTFTREPGPASRTQHSESLRWIVQDALEVTLGQAAEPVTFG